MSLPPRFVALSLSLLLSLTACSDDAGPADTGTTADTGIGSDAGDTSVADTSIGDTAAADTLPPPVVGHESYVPPGLTPEVATRLVILGDSISAGSGASSASNIYHALLAANDDGTYPTESDTDLESLTGGAVEIVDVSRGGATTSNLGGQMANLGRAISLPAAGHTVVVLTIGGNDLQSAVLGGDATGALLTDAMGRIRAMVEFFQDPGNFPDGTSLYLAAVYDPSDGQAQIPTCFFGLSLPQLVAALDVWRAEYFALGTEMGFAVVDVLGGFHGHGFFNDNMMNPYYDADDPTHWFSDCIHPNDRGHHEIRRLFYEAMDPTYRAD